VNAKYQYPNHSTAIMTIEPTSVPAVEGAALGHDAVVDLRGRVEGELDAAAPEAAEEVADDVELEESVQDDRHDDEGTIATARSSSSPADSPPVTSTGIVRRSSYVFQGAALSGGG
jgi:hypothetical protein